ncbi:ethanolamine ammonia-lyase reactivating factor EutA [Marinobacter sp. BSs20148]|jgi:ethanolamine utilization protein EutA|uniref:ethanolamine ammonia-lyase reactivating factor EutA n=1 Tax=Marinobacter sp. BSs20148 TaxID=490759 RepID=UPI0002776889|nr:ethanolamine ammonia-lyase reactivating factor EutA [Marinobacter sp. BSs20148]AFP30233.1 Ethanolamine utilization protein eutA [Marinobacter sp. BSs20148]
MHDADFDHEHPSDFEFGEDIEGVEMFTLTSVGIDIGSSTSHLIFSRLTLRREGSSYSGRFKVTEREVLYRSGILLTPYLSETRIDIEQIKAFVHEAYKEAGLESDDIDTGAVVITGEALKKENAQPIVEYFARDSGKFICASAGPHHEALLAAYGCGAVDLSSQAQATVLNVDMGGGTTKLSLIRHGVVAETASISIGARLVAFDDGDTVTRVEEAGARLLAHCGHSISVGALITEEQKLQLGRLMVKLLIEVIQGGACSELAQSLMITPALAPREGLDGIDHIVFSGGVSEHIYGRDTVSYGDLGLILGAELGSYLKTLPEGMLHQPAECIRATVIGAGEYTLQASGNTSYINDPELLPAYALKVVRIPIDLKEPISEALEAGLTKFDLSSFGEGIALSLSIEGQLDYRNLRKLADAIAGLTAPVPDSPLYILLDQDVAKSLGGILKEELKIANRLIAIDGIEVGDLDYIDIGEPMGFTEVIPVTVKSLLFPTESQAPI